MLLERLPEEGGPNLSLLPMFCFPEGIRLSRELKGFITFTFVLTQENGDRVYANCLCFKEALEESLKIKLNLPPSDRVYYEKAICLLSRERYTDEFAECLKHLYRLSMSKNDVPFHRVIRNFVESMQLPKEVGINGLSYSYGGSNINFDTNPTYPIVSVSMLQCRKGLFIACSSFCHCSASSVSSKLSCLKRKSFLSRNHALSLDLPFKHSFHSSSPSAGSTSSSLFCLLL